MNRPPPARLFDGFEEVDLDVGTGVRIHGVRGGSGPALLLLHGFPQTHALWHRLAPQLADRFTVVATDLRGYGDSSGPATGNDPASYSFRAMAHDQVEVMAALGHERFAVVGHDRGARVALRLARDHPAAVGRLALLDILPTGYVYDHVDRRTATAYYHWFFLIQPYDLPERLIGGDPIAFLHSLLGGWGSGLDVHDPAALAEYERCFADPRVRHAMISDYRAAASVDLEHDRADADALVGAPMLILWGSKGLVGASAQSPVDVWQTQGVDVRGASVDAGHFLVDEAPGPTLAILRDFLRTD